MQTLLQDEVSLIYIRHGRTKKDTVYLIVSNGEESKFLSYVGDEEDLAEFQRGDEISLKVTRDVFSDYGMKAELA